MIGRPLFSGQFCPENRGLLRGSSVEGGVGEVDVFLIHAFLGQGDGFAEALEVDDLPFTQEADDVVDVRIVGETKDVVVGEAGFLLCRQVLRQIGDDVAGDLHGRGRPGVAGGELRIDAGGVIHKISVEAGGFDLLFAQVAGELMDQGAHHFQVPQFFSTY